MRFLHLSDLHFGKTLFEYTLLEDQRHWCRQVLDFLRGTPHDAVVIAGDLYDRAVPAADAVDRLIGFFGPLSFASPGELGDSRITEYVLMELENSGDPKPSHTGEEVREEALRLFGLRDFAPSQDYYRAELDGYSAGGRGFVMANKLSFPGEPEGGREAVEVRCFGDPLQTAAERTLIYTLEEDGAGGWRFVSALPA